eukprot:12736093-Alexandrium_andersonii.AAC.1
MQVSIVQAIPKARSDPIAKRRSTAARAVRPSMPEASRAGEHEGLTRAQGLTAFTYEMQVFRAVSG